MTIVPLASLAVDGRTVRVTLHTGHDGVEFVGRLYFAEDAWDTTGIPDRGVLSGRTADDVRQRAEALPADDLERRWRRATAEKRRYLGLRQLTFELLAKVRYLNQVGVSLRSGLLDPTVGTQELAATEEQMVELVRQMRHLAGVEA